MKTSLRKLDIDDPIEKKDPENKDNLVDEIAKRMRETLKFKRYKIQEVNLNQVILVQVIKDEKRTKSGTKHIYFNCREIYRFNHNDSKRWRYFSKNF